MWRETQLSARETARKRGRARIQRGKLPPRGVATGKGRGEGGRDVAPPSLFREHAGHRLIAVSVERVRALKHT